MNAFTLSLIRGNFATAQVCMKVKTPTIRFSSRFSLSCDSAVEVRRTCARVSTLIPTVCSAKQSSVIEAVLSAESSRVERLGFTQHRILLQA